MVGRNIQLVVSLGWLVFGLFASRLQAAELEVSEVMAGNDSCCTDPQGDYDDWVEIHNTSEQILDLAGFYLTDDWSKPTQWQFPSNKPSLTQLEPNEYLVVWADKDTADSGLHADFKLSLSGEQIGLFASNGQTPIDGFTFMAQAEDLSYGRDPNGGLRFFAYPTPGSVNNEAYLGQVAAPSFSVERGIYDEVQSVALSCSTSGATIRYCLNAQDPIKVTTWGSWVQGYTYVGALSANQTRCIRAMAIMPGWEPSEIVTHSYLMGLDESLRDLPIVSLVAEEGETFYEPNGVMAIVGGQYVDGNWVASDDDDYNLALVLGLKRPVSWEWIEPNNGDHDQVNADLSVYGSEAMRLSYQRADGLWQGSEKFSLRVGFDSAYATEQFDRTDGLILRGGHADHDNPFVKEELLRRCFADMGQVSSVGTFAHLFINGDYMGYVNPCPEVNEVSLQEWTGSSGSFDVMTGEGLQLGSDTSWSELLDWMDQQDQSQDEVYEQTKEMLDLESLVDLTIALLWSGDTTWPNHDWRAFHDADNDGPWTFTLWDADAGFDVNTLETVDFTPLENTCQVYGRFFVPLLDQPRFVRFFGDRSDCHIRTGGALSEAVVADCFTQMQNELALVIPEMDTSILTWAEQRNDALVAACQEQGLYAFTAPDGQLQDDTLTLTNPLDEGDIYYCLDGSDPRDDDVSGFLYSEPIALESSAHLRAAILKQGQWGACLDEVLAVGAVSDSLRISEIMAHPVDTNVEYVELTNIGDAAIGLNYVTLSQGVTFICPDVTLSPGGYGLVVRDVNAFESRYGVSDCILGTYQGDLADGGEAVILRDAVGTTILTLSTYPVWEGITDGAGYSVTVRSSDLSDGNDLADASAWRPSAQVGGSPGWDDSDLLTDSPAVVINEILAHSHDEASDWVEIYNNDEVLADLGGWFLSDRLNDPFKYEIQSGTFIPPGGYMVFYEQSQFGNSAAAGTVQTFALTENGETLCLLAARDGLLTGSVIEQSFGASQTSVSFGRHGLSTGEVHFVLMDEGTPGLANSQPLVGPVVISEVMYHPAIYDDAEYVELVNTSSLPVTLYDYEMDLPWRLTDDPDDPGIDLRFPTDTVVTLAAGERMILTRDQTALARSVSVPEDTQVLEWTRGKLGNGQDTVYLCRPGDVDELGQRYWIAVDRVDYTDGTHASEFPTGVDPWPRSADGDGYALQRNDLTAYGNDPNCWQAGSPSPGQ